MSKNTDNAAGRSIWPVGMIWGVTLGGMMGMIIQMPAQATEPLRLDQFSNIEQVALSPDAVKGTEPAATSQRPVQRTLNAAKVIAPSDTYDLWPNSTLVSMYDSHWQSLQDARGKDEAQLELRMGAIWEVLRERGISATVAAPEMARVSAYITEASVH